MSFDNPMQTDGFEFLEFSSPNPSLLETDFKNLGFKKVAKHKSKAIDLYRQGEINFLINREKGGKAAWHAEEHGSGACAMGFRVKDAAIALEKALERGAEKYPDQVYGYPGIQGIGGTAIYFIDKYGDENIYDDEFEYITDDLHPEGKGLKVIDHLTHNVYRGRMHEWAEFYISLFNFREIRFFDIKGLKTGLISRAMSSPCNKIKIPLNESTDDDSQIEEYLKEYNGEGIQHIALTTEDICGTVESIHAEGIRFLDVPDTYYEMINDRVPWHTEDLPRLQKNSILLDGEKEPSGGLLLQIFTENMLGPVFFEIIQRKGNEGFGEGNFQALFESIERDQIRRGVLNVGD